MVGSLASTVTVRRGCAVASSRPLAGVCGALGSVGVFGRPSSALAFHLASARARSLLSPRASLVVPAPPSAATRECFSLVAEVLPGSEREALRALCRAATASDWSDAELRGAEASLAAQAADTSAAPESALVDLAVGAALGPGSPLARAAAPGTRGPSAPALLRASSRVVVAGVGVSHGDVDACALEANLGAADAAAEQRAAYSGGRAVVASEDADPRLRGVTAHLAHVGVLFEGAAVDSSELCTSLVLQALMGGGSAFSAGGPGKGMHSVLFRTLLTRPWMESASFFAQSFQGCGLMGITASCDPSKTASVVRDMCEQYAGVTAGVVQWDLERAKNSLKSSLYTALEKSSAQCEDLGRQVFLIGRYTEPAAFSRQIDSVSSADVSRLLRKSLNSAPTIAALVPRAFIDEVPRVGELLATIRGCTFPLLRSD
eukprot:m51a1_g5474 Putative mitochondrial processing peptidase subunit alpha (432) ;mRNA; r:289542-291084